MQTGVPVHRLRGSSARLRLIAGAAAVLVLFLLPVPATAAPTPKITIGDVTVAEGTGAPSTASFTIQVSPRPRACCPLQVNWATAPGSATANDFTASSGTVSFTRTIGSRIVTVPVAGDATDEVNETFVVNLAGLVGSPGQIDDAQGVATITDDDQPPTMSIDDVSVTEGDAGATSAIFTVSLSAASGKTVTVDWATAPGSAGAGSDFVSASGSRTIVAGTSSVTIAVSVLGDVLDEVNESFGISLANPTNATLGDGSGVATISDDDPLPLLSIDDVSVTEGHAGTTTATFTVSLSTASGKTVTVDWETVDDDAVQPGDYLTGSGILTFTPGDASETVGVTVNGDVLAELDDAFRVVLSDATNAELGDPEGVGVIVDDEGLPVIDIDEPTITEGHAGTGPMTFSVTLAHAAAWPVTVDWATAAGTAEGGSDYAAANGTVTFAPADTSETVSILVSGDVTFEHDETFSLELSNAAGAPIGDPRGVGTIVNDDAAPALSVTNGSVLEGNAGASTLRFTVSVAGGTEVEASVHFATADLTARAGRDYLPAAGAVTIPAGASGATIDVTVKGDVAYEANETLSLRLDDPTDATLADGVGQGRIRNDDKARTSATLRVIRKPKSLVATGLLEPTKSGHRVSVTLFRAHKGRFVRVVAKTALVRYLRDRDHDGRTDGAYTATFLRPEARGTYKVLVRFKVTPTHKACSRARVFTLPAR